MKKQHTYRARISWTGATAGGTRSYKSYDRTHIAELPGKASFEMTSDPAFLGDPSKLNPEECLLVALSSCHMLSYLALAAGKDVEVIGYEDHATGTMIQEGLGGRFSEVTLRPEVVIASGADEDLAMTLHESANANCFIASSVNFPVKHDPKICIRRE